MLCVCAAQVGCNSCSELCRAMSSQDAAHDALLAEVRQLHTFLASLDGEFRSRAMEAHVANLKARVEGVRVLSPEGATALVELIKEGPWMEAQAGTCGTIGPQALLVAGDNIMPSGVKQLVQAGGKAERRPPQQPEHHRFLTLY